MLGETQPRTIETTGRYKVIFGQGVTPGVASRFLHDHAGMRVADAREVAPSEIPTGLGEGVVLDELGAAVVHLDHDQFRSLSAASTEVAGAILRVSPEFVLYALTDGRGQEYVQGFRDGLDFALGSGRGGLATMPGTGGRPVAALPPVWDESAETWGRQITRAAGSRFTGRGVRIAVLDTGLAAGIGDYHGRTVVAESFVPGDLSTDDVHGHGTHCAGTACGTSTPGQPPRYGVAPDAELFIGRVLGRDGRGNEGWILAGVNWALRNRCDIVSMSLGAWVPRGFRYDDGFEALAARALARGTLIVAAAGNDSRRPAQLEPVNHPANCPSVLAVAALSLTTPGATPSVDVARFSNAGLDPEAEVNLAAPGEDVLSSWPHPPFTRRLMGTSMATPHVAGIAALWAESKGIRGRALWEQLRASAVGLPYAAADVGWGLAVGP
jgi:subtilisin family serine protease